MEFERQVKIGLIIDNGSLAAWQAEALRLLGPAAEFVVYDCRNSRPERRRLRFALYYLLNLFTIRNPLTRRVSVPPELKVLDRRPFDSNWEGAWQRLPATLLETIRGDSPDAMVKFGMGLLRVPDSADLTIPILSYHHGNPQRFRGRPAGFYELLGGETVMGQVVQVLSNRLDSGEIVAAAETRVAAYSYRKTLMQAYAVSPLLLERAIRVARSREAYAPAGLGRNYRLPSNLTVIRLMLAIARRRLARLGYGLFVEKIWRVATVETGPSLASISEAIRDTERWNEVPTPPGCRFLADPFFSPRGDLIVEALDTRSSRGQLFLVGERNRVFSGPGGHFSYPSTVDTGDGWFVIPEVSDWSSPLAYPLEGERLGAPFELDIPDRPRLLDPTVFVHRGTIYLFANVATEGGGVLRLWVADDLAGKFAEHPASPVRISPRGGRMGGAITTIDGQLTRIGQDFGGAYGDGLSIFHVDRIDRETYIEERIGELRLQTFRGPHTLNLAKTRAAFDYYTDRFSVLAGVRRLRERKAAGRIIEAVSA